MFFGSNGCAFFDLHRSVQIQITYHRAEIIFVSEISKNLLHLTYHLAEHPDLAGRMGRSAREAYLAKYTIGHAVEAFERLWSNPP